LTPPDWEILENLKEEFNGFDYVNPNYDEDVLHESDLWDNDVFETVKEQPAKVIFTT
jgi:hypothetical protein